MLRSSIYLLFRYSGALIAGTLSGYYGGMLGFGLHERYFKDPRFQEMDFQGVGIAALSGLVLAQLVAIAVFEFIGSVTRRREQSRRRD